jgi:hypothetical protein
MILRAGHGELDAAGTGRDKGLLKKMNIERPTSNVEWEKMKKQTYDLEERLLIPFFVKYLGFVRNQVSH